MKLIILILTIALGINSNLNSNIYLPLFTYDENTNTEYYVYLSNDYTSNHNLVIKNGSQNNELTWDYKFYFENTSSLISSPLDISNFIFEYEEKSNSLIVYNGKNLSKFDGNDGIILKNYNDLINPNNPININEQYIYNVLSSKNQNIDIRLIDLETESSDIINIDIIYSDDMKLFFTKNSKYLAISLPNEIIKYDLQEKKFVDTLSHTFNYIKEVQINNNSEYLVFHDDDKLNYIQGNINFNFDVVINYGFISDNNYFVYSAYSFDVMNKDNLIENINLENELFGSDYIFHYVYKYEDTYKIAYPTEMTKCDEMPSLPYGHQFLSIENNRLKRFPNNNFNRTIKSKINQDNKLISYCSKYIEIRDLQTKESYLIDFRDSSKNYVKSLDVIDSNLILINYKNEIEVFNYFTLEHKFIQSELDTIVDILNYNDKLYLIADSKLYEFTDVTEKFITDLVQPIEFVNRNEFFFIESSGDSTLIYFDENSQMKISNYVDDKKYYLKDYNPITQKVIFSESKYKTFRMGVDPLLSYVYDLKDNSFEKIGHYISHDAKFVYGDNIFYLYHDIIMSGQGYGYIGYFEFLDFENKDTLCERYTYAHELYSYDISPDSRYLYTSTCGNFDNVIELCPEMFETGSVISETNDFIAIYKDYIQFNKQVQNLRITDLLGNFQNIDYKPEIDISHLKRGVYILQFTYNNKIYNYKFLKE